jgi:hypothetical protein
LRGPSGSAEVGISHQPTGEIVYRHQLASSANAPIAVFGNTVLVPAGAPETSSSGRSGHPQLVAYTLS